MKLVSLTEKLCSQKTAYISHFGVGFFKWSSRKSTVYGTAFGKCTSLQWCCSTAVATAHYVEPARWPSLPQHLSGQQWPSSELELLRVAWGIALAKKARARFTFGEASGTWLKQPMTSSQHSGVGKDKLGRCKERPWERRPRIFNVYPEMTALCLSAALWRHRR